MFELLVVVAGQRHTSTKYASTKLAYCAAEANQKGTLRYKQQLKVSTTLDVLYGDATIGTYVDDC